MDQFGTLEIEWAEGHTGTEVNYIDENVICYQCGKNVKFLSEDGTEQIFAFKGEGQGPIASHALNKHFAIAEHCLKPKIFIYEYPSFEEIAVLKVGARLEFQRLVFSFSEFFASFSGVPDFELILWKYETGEKLTKLSLDSFSPTSFTFNPGNWRQMCITATDELLIIQIEQSHDTYLLVDQKIKLPAEDRWSLDVVKDEVLATRSSTRMTRYTVDMPKAAVAGLVGEMAEKLDEIQDETVRVQPVSHTWIPSGDIFVGCKGGQLMKVDVEMMTATVVYYPPDAATAPNSGPPSAHKSSSNLEENSSFIDSLTTPVMAGSLSSIVFHKLGLFAAGEDGTLRKIDLTGNEYLVKEECRIGLPITTIGFCHDYTHLVAFSPRGCFYLYDIDNPECIMLKNMHHGNFIGLGTLASLSETCVSCREDGFLQAWDIHKGTLKSTLDLDTECTHIACSPLCHMVVVGSKSGHIFFVDYTSVLAPRLIHCIRVFSQPVCHLMFDEDGQYIFVSSNDDHVLVLDGHSTVGFKVLGYTVINGNVMGLSCYKNGHDVQVVVTYNSDNEPSRGGNELTLFTITPQLMRELDMSYNSMKQDFKDAAINRMNLHLTVPSSGVAIGEGNKIYIIDHHTKMICTIPLPESKPKRANGPESFLSTDNCFHGHQLPDGQLLLSPHNKWLASYGADGAVMIRATGSMDRYVTITPHEFQHGGVKFARFSEECEYIFTAGFDGILTCYKWNFSPTGVSKVKSAIDLAQNRKMKLMVSQDAEETNIKKWSEWTQSRQPSRTTSAFEKLEQEKIERTKQEALEKETIYKTPTPTPKPDATWLEEQQYKAYEEEDKEYTALKMDIRVQIRDIRKQIQNMMMGNDQLPAIEKLSRDEFDLDVEEQAKLHAEGDAEIQRVKEEIEFENLAKIYLREVIKKECWDEMKVKGRALKSFNSTLEVSNFPMRERSEAVIQQLEAVSVRRKLEMDELPVRKREAEQGLKSMRPDEDQLEEEDEDHTEQPSTTGSLGAMYGGFNELFYSQFELHTREQKINQIVLLEDAIYRIKTAFNVEFGDVFQKKEQEIAKIKDKNKRIIKIMDDLDLKEAMQVPEMCAAEKPEMLLLVEDSEVKIEKFMTPEQRKKFEESKKLEEERRLRERVDNARERALDQMMGGVLEIKKEDELKKDVPKPAFMLTKKEEEWSEDEQKLVKDYEKKVKDLQEERDKYRKQLETELRKLQAMIADGMTSFDDTLNQLFMRKIKIMMVVYQEELKIYRLRYSLLMEEELEVRNLELNRLLSHKKILKNISSDALLESRKNVDQFRDDYDILTAEDKVIDKSFKREFPDVSAVMFDYLSRLFRKRPRGQKYRSATGDGKSINPFAERPSSARQNSQANRVLEAALDDMDKESNMPEGLDPHTWERFCRYRRDKIYSEQLVKTKALVLAEMNAFLQKRGEEDDFLRNEIDEITDLLKTLKEDKTRFILNLEVQLLLKQGQVEIDTTNFVPDFHSSVLLHRIVVEELNGTIKQLGESKITSMVESKDFRKGIIQLEWEHKRMLMQVTDLQNKMKDIQFMKVTREIQAFLNEADYDMKKLQEVATLESTILLLKRYHEKNVDEKKKILRDLNKTVNQRHGDNSSLNTELDELNVSVNERLHIDEVNAESRMDTGAEKRYQEIVQRRKLVDLAKAQAQEVAVLRAEVERLRMRTFPALVQVEH